MLTKPPVPYDLCVALVGAFSVITNSDLLRMELFEALEHRGKERGKTTLKQTQSEKGSVTRTRSQEAAISSQPHTPGPALAPPAELVTEGAGLGGSGGWGCGQGAGQPGSSFSAMVP